MRDLTSNTSSLLYAVKAFAILLVVAAHITFSEGYPVAEIIRSSLGQIGVIIFFFVSGFLYSREKGDTRVFWNKKAKNLFIPWIVFSIITFALSKIIFGAKQNLIFGFIKHFFGVGTWFWYMTILVIILAVFKCLYDKDWTLYLCMAISVVSVVLSFTGIIKYNTYFNQYLNLFNWLGIFALGVYFRKHDLLERIIGLKYFIFSLVGTIMSVVFAVLRGIRIEAYVDAFSLLVELLGLVLFINLSSMLHKSKLLCDVGKKSFFIYLMHIQVVGLINTRLPYNWFFFILRPFIGLAACYLIASGVKFVLCKMGISKSNFVFGLDR